MERITIRRPDDFHCHLRSENVFGSFERFRMVVGHTARQFARALVMPNNPAILTAGDAIKYRSEIVFALPSGVDFTPLMTIKLVQGLTSPLIIKQAKKAGIIAGKAYPVGVTTGSEQGISDFDKMFSVFEAMEEAGMVLSIHGEAPGSDICCLAKENIFIDILKSIVETFPNLRIVLEHITTAFSVVAIQEFFSEKVAATITAHHLFLTLDDIIGGNLSPHNFCKPVSKTLHDREALRGAAMSGNPKFFFGSDSAPHLRSKKECASGSAGIFSAPAAVNLLAEIFDKYNALNRLENFLCVFGAQFYGLPLNEGKMRLIRNDWVVPDEYDGIVPFMAGQKMSWQIF